MKKALVVLVVLGIAGVAGWQIWVRVTAAGKQAARERTPVPVEIAPVEQANIRDIGVFTGSLQPKAQFIVAPKIGGRLVKLLVDVGDPVQRDQLIAQLDDEELTQEVEQARAERDVAQANAENGTSDLELARREFERVQTLREKKVASEAELDAAQGRYMTAQARCKVAAAQVAQKEAALKAAEVRLGYTRVLAHWERENGPRIVGERFVDEGALLQANEPIVSVLEDRVLVGAIHVIERDYPKIRIGQEATITTDAFPGEPFPGRIVRIAPFMKESSRQARVEIDVPNPDRRLASGMFIRVSLQFADHAGATVVPGEALVKREGRPGVFAADVEARKARFVPVTVGIRNSERAEVLEPALEGFVVTLGQHLLEDGSPILLPQESKPAADAEAPVPGDAP